MSVPKGEKRAALVVGNAHYDEARGLKNPINDAKAVSRVLRSPGFDLITVDHHSEHNTNLGLAPMARALADFSVEAEPAQKQRCSTLPVMGGSHPRLSAAA